MGDYSFELQKILMRWNRWKTLLHNLMVANEVADRFLDGWGYFEGTKPVFAEMMDWACEQVASENGAETGVLGIKKPLITGVRTVRN